MVNFRRQLWSLARTSPGYGGGTYGAYTDAYEDDLDEVADMAAMADHGEVFERDELAYRRSPLRSGGQPPPPLQTPRRQPGSYRRRRHILSVLALLAVATVVPAALMGGPWWIGQAVSGGLLVIYVTLLVRRQRRLVERAQKVRYLAPIRAPRPAVVVLGSGAVR
jgi:hypothetical protein